MGEEQGGGIHAQHKTTFHLLSNNKAVGLKTVVCLSMTVQ